MKKITILLLSVILLTGCTVVRIDTKSIDNTINVVLSKKNQLYNQVGKGYKYYIPRGVNHIDTSELNDRLYSNGNYYYLYIDVISYYYQKEFDYQINKNAYYSRKLNFNGQHGYLEINKNKDKYFIEFMYNYAKIEAMVDKEDINDVVLNASYILSTIKFNSNVIKLMLDEDFFSKKEKKYDIFTSKKNISNFVEYFDEEDNNKEVD